MCLLDSSLTLIVDEIVKRWSKANTYEYDKFCKLFCKTFLLEQTI